MNDIEIIKEKIIKPFYEFPNPISIELKDTDVKLIENLINRVEELEKEEKELEHLLTSQLGFNLYRDYIPKSKIKEEIKKYEWAIKSYDCDEANYKQSQAVGSWNVLRKLLEE